MQPEKNTEDLEYLAALGFEQVKYEESDLNDLTKRVRTKSFSYNNGSYFYWISLLVGMFIGISVVGFLYQPSPEKISMNHTTVADSAAISLSIPDSVTSLDTVNVEPENFVKQHERLSSPPEKTDVVTSTTEPESPLNITPLNVDLSSALNSSVKEKKIKFMMNAPVFYLHDLKVTNYATLYFKKNQFVRAGGTSAANSIKETNSQNVLHLKESVDIFLHEQIAEALLLFKKGKYDLCIKMLGEISDFNKEDVNCDFYSAMCFYHKFNYKKAVDLFDRCISSQNNTFLQEATYYKALCLYQSGDVNSAKAVLNQIVEEGEFYAVKAENFLNANKLR